jgi:hypothetical protein
MNDLMAGSKQQKTHTNDIKPFLNKEISLIKCIEQPVLLIYSDYT